MNIMKNLPISKFRQVVPAGRKRSTLWKVLLAVCLSHLALPNALGYELEVLNNTLDNPWSLAFLPGNEMLLTQLGGQLHRVSANGELGEPIDNVPEVYYAGQGGLFDVVVHPDYERNSLIYLSYAHGDKSANATRIARAKLVGNRLEAVEVIFTVTPTKDTAQHYGGRMLFLPDGTLLLTTGDGFDYREQAQNTQALLGKTIRINDDGSLPADNPFQGDSDQHPAIWTYGHRNPQGLALDPRSGAIYLHEHGPRGGDEINLLNPGNNSGWPAITYGMDYNGAYVSPFSEYAGMEQPLKYWVPSIAPSGFALYRGSRFPEWDGSLFIGALVDKEVRRVTIAADGSTEEEVVFSEIDERIRDIRVAPDGLIYLLTDGNPGSLIRVSEG